MRTNRRPSRFSICLGLAFGLAVGISNPLHAQSGTSPSCPPDQSPDSGTRGDGDDIQCRINNLLTSNQTFINNMKSKTSSCSGKHCDLLSNYMDRAQNAENHGMHANGRMKGSDYSDLNTLRKAKCNGKKSDCASGNGDYTGGETDMSVGEDIANQLDEATKSLNKANDMMSAQSGNTSALERMRSLPPASFSPLYNYTKDADYPKWLHSGILAPDVIEAGIRFAYLSVAQVNETLKQVTEDACKETVVALGEGGNTSLACMVITLAARAAEASYEVFEFANDNTSEWELHGVYEREGNLNDNIGVVDADVANVQAGVGNTQVAISQLQAQVDALQTSMNDLKAQLSTVSHELSEKLYVNNDMDKQIMQLLLVPDGNRKAPASLLTCTGDSDSDSPCPSVAFNCSLKTGDCSFNSH